MSRDLNMILAGFGGQGVLFLGKVAAYAGLIDGKEVSWLPSYGPEMRGGTANCSVCISEQPIGSPLVTAPNVLVAMNLPSYEKFIDTCEAGAVVVLDSFLIDVEVQRKDIKVFYVEATKLASEKGLQGLANMILLGKLFEATAFASFDALQGAVEKSVPPRKAHLVEKNMEAIEVGRNA